MKLDKVLEGVEIIEKYNYTKNFCIKNIAINCDKIQNANMFVCINGGKFDTHNMMCELQDFIDVFVVEKINDKINKTQVLVSNTRKILLKLLLNFNYLTKSKIKFIGITGTNGKTSTATYCYNLLQSIGISSAYIGTNGCDINKEHFDTSLTTPDAFELVEMIKKMSKLDVKYAFLEVSAHAILYYKIIGLEFQIGLFTNLTQDHLDDFGSIDNYAKYKTKFLNMCKIKIVNFDDAYCNKNFKSSKYIKVSSKEKSCKYLYKVENSFLYLKIDDKLIKFKTNLFATFCITNLIFALSILNELKFDLSLFEYHIQNMPDVPGRFNFFRTRDICFCVDYAHTPDAIENCLKNLKSRFDEIICVFGASGFRDSLKREKMGKIASKYASYIVLTADNPRYESVSQICASISKGITIDYVFIENREKAIYHAFALAKKNSVIAILGKGNEISQDICACDIGYSDIDVVKNIVKDNR